MAIPLPSYTEIAALIKKGMTLEAHEKIMELREAALACREENLALKERLKDLEEKQTIKDQLYFDGRVYWLGTDITHNHENGPFCASCYDKDEKLIRLQFWPGGTSLPNKYKCLVCSMTVNAK